MAATSTAMDHWKSFSPLHSITEYIVDAMQRSVMFWETMHQRGNIYLEHRTQGKPPVLAFPYEMLMDGREMENPCNYILLRVIPEDESTIDPQQRPFVVVDPRAGHGPGIGGSKRESQIGIALSQGHPVYFISFFPEPVPGQTLDDVGKTEIRFIEEVIRRHPKSAKPCVIGNCQAGWAVAALAAMAPDVLGPIMLNGAPLSYWAGVDGKNPMRYVGGLLGGKWLATLASDLGNGKFDGSHLVVNFESLNPSNTLWGKQYNLYANIDSERERYLGFEKWWGGFFYMNAAEMDAIVTQLFIGNKLAKGEIVVPGGQAIDLRNIKSPIIVFASMEDNITPPQQALNWIIDLYGHEDAIIERGQVIVYMLHESTGHLGIFVSAKVARKEHTELVNTLAMIDRLLPGLYEMIIEAKTEDTARGELVPGDHVVRLESRTVDDLRALDDTQDDDAIFAPMVAVSEANDKLYETFLQPWVQMMTTEASANCLRELHPLRLERSIFSDLNPFMSMLPRLAEITEHQRQPVSEDNLFLTLERQASEVITGQLDAWRDQRDKLGEELFKAIYGPWGMGGLFPAETSTREVRENIRENWQRRHAHLIHQMEEGEFTEAVVRIVCAVVLGQRKIERRSHLIADALIQDHPRLTRLKTNARETMGRQQASLLWLDRKRALAALTSLLPTKEDRREAMSIVDQVLEVQKDTEAEKILAEIHNILGLPTTGASAKTRTKHQPTAG